MRSSVPLTVLLMLLVMLAGCVSDDDPPTSGPGGTQGAGEPQGPADNDNNTTGNNITRPRPTTGPTTISSFYANRSSGEAPLSVKIHLNGRSTDPDSTWTIEFGDTNTTSGNASTLPIDIFHEYGAAGNYTATATIEASDAQPSKSIEFTVIEAVGEPPQLTFEYGPTLGCVGDVTGTCVSREAGPDQEHVDGVWQELDPRYWGLSFTTTAPGTTRGDTDCWAVDADGANIDEDLNGGAEACSGVLPSGTKWLYLYSYAEPAVSMTLTFEP